MSNKVKKIFEIFELVQNPKEIIIFTQAFKVKGTLITDKNKLKDEVITLMDAVICPHFEKCQCEDAAKYVEWLNIFEEDIIAFSVVG